jgi:phosphoglycerate dehydrogenase-like enzyme
MMRIVIEDDHFLKILPVILDPDTPDEHAHAVADFFAHDVPDFLEWCARFRVELGALYPASVEFAFDQADLDDKAARADAIVVESLKVTRETLQRAHDLKAVVKFGAVARNIDVSACVERRIAVMAVRRKGNIAVAEQAFALLLALAKQIPEFDHVVSAADLAAAGYPVRPYDRRYCGGSNYGRIAGLRTLAGSVIGLVGLGEVGREIATRAAAFGMSIVYTQRHRLPQSDELALGARYLEIGALMAESDYVVVQLPLNEATRGILGARELGRAKPGAILVNTARAALVDREALLDALDSGRLGGLGLDVGYDEPWSPNDPLLKCRGNIVLMPHTAVGNRTSGLDDLAEVCRNLHRALIAPKRVRF